MQPEYVVFLLYIRVSFMHKETELRLHTEVKTCVVSD